MIQISLTILIYENIIVIDVIGTISVQFMSNYAWISVSRMLLVCNMILQKNCCFEGLEGCFQVKEKSVFIPLKKLSN